MLRPGEQQARIGRGESGSPELSRERHGMRRYSERTIGDLTIRIDRTLCVGFGDCIAGAPDAFAFDADGIAEFAPGAGSTSREDLLRACKACPVDAIMVLDGDGKGLVP